uniref:RING-type domain-containing protein n=1 Tax=Salix viminalis TaxID=40686 RepID=A0A6N2L852_SALVM
MQPPASKASIEAMPGVEIGEDNKDGECAICLEEWESGAIVRKMPCKPRYEMPFDEEEMKGESGGELKERFGRNRDSDENPSSDSTDFSTSSPSATDHETMMCKSLHGSSREGKKN